MAASSSRPRSGMDLPTDITDIIADMLLEQKSLTYDEKDISRDAAKCMLVGNPAFTTIGQTLYKAISPRLGHDTEGRSEKSTIVELKSLLKAWKLSLGGSKPELWKRIYDQVSVPEDCNDQLCPASTATRDFVRGLNEAMVSQSKAKDLFNLSKNSLEGLPCEVQYGGGFGISYNYRLADVKAKCIELYGGWKGVQKLKERSKEWSEQYNKRKEDIRTAIRKTLEARGVDMGEGSIGQRTLKSMWYLEFDLADVAGARAAADKVQSHIWFITRCPMNFSTMLSDVRANYKPRKQSQYRMEIETEDYAKARTLEEWVSEQDGGLDRILADPMLPACLHDGVRSAWRKLEKEGRRS